MNNKANFIIAGGHKIAYRWVNNEFDQSKPVIVFLHEGLGCMKQWKDFPAELCSLTGFNGLMYDRYGYGESESINEPRNDDFLRREACCTLPEILQKLNITDKIILFGHSDGGTIALFYASCFPDKINCLIAVAPHVFLEDISIRSISMAVREFNQGNLEKKLSRHHKDNTKKMFESWVGIWLDEKVRNWNMFKELTQIKSPILIIQGEKDNYGSFLQIDNIFKYVNGEVYGFFLNNCGHFPHFEFKQEVLSETAQFICMKCNHFE